MGLVKKFDAIVVLGTGIREDGSLPPSSQATVRKAVALLRSGVAPRIIMSGKWAYTISYKPPLTEATAMKRQAIVEGVAEDQSETTVSNLCLVKKHYLEPHKWKTIVLISVYPQSRRAFYNFEHVMGPGYTTALMLADFTYPIEKLREIEKAEDGKMREATHFLSSIPAGDHEEIYRLAMKDLRENYKNTI